MADSLESPLLGCLAQSFRTILQEDHDKLLNKDLKEKKQKERAKKKKKDKDSKETEKEPEERRVVREGNNSLITYPNASTFSVFNHIRHFVLQQELCNTYNFRNQNVDDLDSEGEDGKEEGKDGDKQKEKLPEVVNLGIRGVFTILKEVWHSAPELCLKVLSEFLNILQGQSPSGLKKEPPETTAGLFELLVQMVSEPLPADHPVSKPLVSMASSCLLSLVIGLGETDKMLAAISALMITSWDVAQDTIKVPDIMRTLQSSVQVILVGDLGDSNWNDSGIPSKSKIDTWSLEGLLGGDTPTEMHAAAIACDARYLYIHGPFGLAKIGSGYGNTTKGQIYEVQRNFHNDRSGRLMFASGKLYFTFDNQSIDVIDPVTLKLENSLELDAEAVGPQCLFSNGSDLNQIIAKKEGNFMLRKLTTLCSPVIPVEEKAISLSQESILSLGKAKYNSRGNITTLYHKNNNQAPTQVIATKAFAAVLTASGEILYQGEGVVMGVTDKESSKDVWKKIDFPEKKAKVQFLACDNSGSFSIAVTDKGAAYFGGTNKKGEAAENPAGGRQGPKPIKFKKMNKVKDHEIVSAACGPHCSALISRDGKLLMFGSLEEDVVDKSSGVVTGLLGVPVSQVALGRSHTCVLTQHGTVYTFGTNQYGQCGRDYVPPKEGQDMEEDEAVDESSDDSMEGDDDVCAAGEHTFAHNKCMVCRFCKFCTGYGPSCCNEGLPGRDSGNECGCGSGDSGCTTCGACKVCVGVADEWSGGMHFEEVADTDQDMYETIIRIRQLAASGKKEKKKKEDKGGILQLLFGGGDDAAAKEASEDKKPEQEKPSTNKPAAITLPDDNTVMQVACGAFHTALLLHNGDVYVFGNGNHGQLGQGNNKPIGHPVKVPLPGPAQQVACGDNHTVILLASGDIYTFGKHQDGQLGRGADDLENSSWNMLPGPISSVGGSFKAKWVSACCNQTFIGVNEALVPVEALSKCQVFASQDCIGLVPPILGDQQKPNLITINPSTSSVIKHDGDEQQNLADCAVCLDKEYNVLWCYTPTTMGVACYNIITSEVKDFTGTILSPSLCLPKSKEIEVPRSQVSLNLLSSLYTISGKTCTSVSAILTGKKLKTFTLDDYKILSRFNSQGGGWGYSNGSVEAVRFSPDQDVLLGGIGLFGGRGQYNADVKIFELGESADPETEGTLVASGEEKSYSCDRNSTFRLLFDKPVLLTGDNWYVCHVTIVSPSGASTDAGSSGQGQITGADKVQFKFKNSRKSNNGTDVGSGQIPELLYKIPEFEQESGGSMQVVGKEFASTVTPQGLQSVLQILEWGWDQLSSDSTHIDYVKIVVKNSLGILCSHICEVYPERGPSQNSSTEEPELHQCVYKTLWLIKRIFSSKQATASDKFKDLVSICHDVFVKCFHAFYPSALLKWFALCHLIQQFDPSDIVAGFPYDNILQVVLEALSSRGYSYIGLNYDTSTSLGVAINNSMEDERYPNLAAYMHQKTLNDYKDGEILAFTVVCSKLLGLVSASLRASLTQEFLPTSPIVKSAGQFLVSRINELALCSAYPEAAALSGIPVASCKKKEKVMESSVRFPSREVGYPALFVTDVIFSVNKSIILNGVALFGGQCEDGYKYTVTIFKGEDIIKTVTGTFSSKDYYGKYDLVNITFPDPLSLEQDQIYTARVDLEGSSYNIGVDGILSVTGPGGVTFTLHTGISDKADPNAGPLAKFLYSSPSEGPQNVVQLSVHLASMLLDLTVGFLERLLGDDISPRAFEVLTSSFLVSTLLPTTIAQLGPIACQQAKSAVSVLEIVRRTLPIISTAIMKLCGPEMEGNEYLETKLMHYATVETDHPYKPASVSYYKVKFPDPVQWMSLEFDPRCGFAQQEDRIASLLIPRQGTTPSSGSSEVVVSPMVTIGMDDLYSDFQHCGLDAPAGLVLLPGNEVHIIVNTDTEYEKRDKSNHFGMKCKLIGYEWSSDMKQCLSLLEKELVTLGGMCAGALLTDDLNIPYQDELPVSTAPSDTEKADMRIVEAAAQQVLAEHCQLLSRGLLLDTPSVSSILHGSGALASESSEQMFLQDFIKSKSDTSGGRLARWLQPDRSVDPERSVLELVSTETPQVGKQTQFIVRTKDQDDRVVYVEGMNVDVKSEWRGKGSGSEPSLREGVDSVTGVRRPTFKRPFNPTVLGTNHAYQSICMMMPYSDYSHEELRFYAPKMLGSVENMAITCNKDGTYTATWVPTMYGTYIITVAIEGTAAGKGQTIEVLPSEQTVEEVVSTPSDEKVNDEEEEEKIIVEVVKKKIFTGKKAAGLRVRMRPSFAATAIGLIKPGNIVSYSEEIENDVGKWIKLTPTAINELKCTKSEGYALSYSSAKDDSFLDDAEPEEVKHVIKKKRSYGKRLGGPGTYSVVQCGAAGHNVRSKPSMKGVPIGRLAKDNKVQIVEELENDDGIWLKLSKDSVAKHCETDAEGWTLVVHPSGRIFLTQEGDTSYKAFEPRSTTAHAYPTAASVFGTNEKTSIFGTSQAPVPPPPLPGGFQFGGLSTSSPPVFQFAGSSVKLMFGKGDVKPKADSKDTKVEPFSFFAKKPEEKEKEKDDKDDKKDEEGKKEEEKGQEKSDEAKETADKLKSPVFNIGVGGDKRSRSPRRRRIVSKVPNEEKAKDESKPDTTIPEEEERSPSPASSPPPGPAPHHALSPAVAECQRAIFAAFLWHEGLVHDAMACATYLKFHSNLIKPQPSSPHTKDRPDDKEGKEDESKKSKEEVKSKVADAKPKGDDAQCSILPPTLNHLVTFWDEIAVKVLENSSSPFPPPKTPSFAQELQRRYEEEKKEMEKLKKEREKSSGGGGGGGGQTICELCNSTFPDPVTYHMKEVHPGCGKHASGWGYNSRGSYCSGWAGNCGDGGRGGSTWYLLCKDCHAKYLSQMHETKRKVVRPVMVPKMKTRKPGKPRALPVLTPILGMIQNAKFLLEINSSSDSGKTKPRPEISRQTSTPEDVKEKTGSLPREKAKEAPVANASHIPPLLRSVSVATGKTIPPKRLHSDSGEDSINGPPSFGRQRTLEPTEMSSDGLSTLMTKPSMALANLMYLRSRHVPVGKESGYGRMLSFVLRYHDLDGLRASMKQAMRIASIRSFALEFLEWLLVQVHNPSVVHDILWQFLTAISDHPMAVAGAQAKIEERKEEDTKDLRLGKHPLTGLDGGGCALIMLRRKFHSFLQTIANKMNKLPVGSAAQQMALQCWCLDFQSHDHSFLLQSKVFANISNALSNMEDTEGDNGSCKKTATSVGVMENILSKGKLKVSSNDALSNSLTDGSTETFWESRDEPRGKARSLTVTFDKPATIFAASVHIDNQKDSGQRVDQVTVLAGPDDSNLKETDKCKLGITHAGWKTLTVDLEACSVVKIELKGVQNNIRCRQVQILSHSTQPGSQSNLSTIVAMLKDCEAEALRLFRLLTSQVFGRLLTSQQQEEAKEEANGQGEEEETSAMANILLSKGRLSDLQKAVCQHIMGSIHTEATRLKEEWIKNLASQQPPPIPPKGSQHQANHDPPTAETPGGKEPDTYIYELLTMLSGLSQSDIGCTFLSEQSQLVQDLLSLLHTASSKIQLLICSILRCILPYIKPKEFAVMLGVTVLPPLGYSAIAEAVNSAATINQLGLMDCLLAVIAKALSVQVKAKGRGSNILQTLTGDNNITAVTLANLKGSKTVVGEAQVRTQRWYLRGSADQEVGIEIVKLLKDMMKGSLKGQWKDYAKSSIGQAVLHLTKINEDSRIADPGMYSHTLWLCLAALCVIDEEHADALSSGQWLGQDGKPQAKPLCDNHDDGETKALILCETCGNLCGECDRVLHYPKRAASHQRQVFKEEEEAVKVDLHEGCGRIKLYWTMALADSRTLKGMVEFKDMIGGGGKGSCRFCGSNSTTGLLAIGNVCMDSECQERAQNICDKTLPCGHPCCGVKDEKICLSCLHGCGEAEGVSKDRPPLKQDADDMCMICYTEGLSCAPCIQLECGHIFHYHCCHNALAKKWSGPRVTFRFMFCSICENKPIAHPHLAEVATPLIDLYDDVKRKCLLRLEYENLTKCEAITSASSKFYQKPLEYAMWKYAYYVCFKCKKAYYGGEANCAEAVGASDDYDPSELVCPPCAHTGGAVQVCAKHGSDFLEYKCRYCCSVAVYFCFGTTHFCNPCHDDFQRLTSMPKSELPQCPVGPRAKPLSGTECPLHVKHPPTGDEYALGCGVCRNAQTF